jgi:DNA invertase Pin-like site-specific DNA recombinase
MPPSFTYEDHISARGEVTRTDFQRMLQDAKLGKSQLLLVGRVDRFARNERDGWNYLHDLIEAGAIVYFCDEDCAAGLDEDWQEEVSDKLTAAANWSRTISKNLKKAYRQQRSAGEYTGRRAPWGFRRTTDKKALEFDPDQIGGLRYAVDAILENRKVLAEIADELTEGGYRVDARRRITKRLLNRILKNPILKGSWRIHVNTPEYKELPDCAPRLVSDQDFERIGKILRARSGQGDEKRNMRRTHTYVLVGLLRCGDCGESMMGGGAGRLASGEEHVYYDHPDRGCGTQHSSHRPSFRQDRLLEQIDRLFEQVILPADALRRIREFLDSEQSQLPDVRVVRGRLEDELERLDRSFRHGGYGQDPAPAEEVWLRERTAVLIKIGGLPDEATPVSADTATVLQLNEVWSHSDTEGKRLIIERLIERIEVRRFGRAGVKGSSRNRDDRITKVVPRPQFRLLLACAIDEGMCASTTRSAHVSSVVGVAEFRAWRSRIGRPEAA